MFASSKFMFSKKVIKIDEILDLTFDTYIYLHSVKSKLEILSIFVVFLENTNFLVLKSQFHLQAFDVNTLQ
jgi:hypothetical protein